MHFRIFCAENVVVVNKMLFYCSPTSVLPSWCTCLLGMREVLRCQTVGYSISPHTLYLLVCLVRDHLSKAQSVCVCNLMPSSPESLPLPPKANQSWFHTHCKHCSRQIGPGLVQSSYKVQFSSFYSHMWIILHDHLCSSRKRAWMAAMSII